MADSQLTTEKIRRYRQPVFMEAPPERQKTSADEKRVDPPHIDSSCCRHYNVISRCNHATSTWKLPMKAQLQSELSRIEAMIEKAEELADSENETTASRYEAILECLNSVVDSLEEAIAEFN